MFVGLEKGGLTTCAISCQKRFFFSHEPNVYQIVSLEIESDHTRMTLTLFLSELYNYHKLSVSEVTWEFVAFTFLKFHVSDTIWYDFLNKK